LEVVADHAANPLSYFMRNVRNWIAAGSLTMKGMEKGAVLRCFEWNKFRV